MYRDNEETESFIKSVMNKVSVVTVELLCYMLKNQFEDTVNDSYIGFLLRHLQNDGILLLSEDGYVMTKGAYVSLTDDIFFDNLLPTASYRVKSGIDYSKSRDGIDCVDCMWFLATMLPKVSEYIINTGVWDLQFIVAPDEKHDARLYQVVKFKKGYEVAKSLLIESTQHIENERDRLQIRRIALFDDENMVFKVPKKCGFNFVAVTDSKQQQHFRILERIKVEDAW